jgi:hypothetical protein
MVEQKPKTKAHEQAGNLYQEYDPEFMAQFVGCHDQDCMRECNLATGFCARLQLAWERWEIEQAEKREAELTEDDGAEDQD